MTRKSSVRDASFPQAIEFRRLSCMLEENYRSHKAIIKIPSDLFYESKLTSADTDAKTSLCQWDALPTKVCAWRMPDPIFYAFGDSRSSGIKSLPRRPRSTEDSATATRRRLR
jgi:hypothetical protein